MTALVVGLDHVQVAAPPGCERDARRFFGDVLGLPELPKPEELASRGGVWFACGDGEVHVGVDEAFSPARKAHPAFRVRDLPAVRERLAAAGHGPAEEAEFGGVARFYVDDPFGNRLEFTESR